MAKIKIGDLVRVKLLNDMYMWVHVLFDSQFIVKVFLSQENILQKKQ